MFSLSKPGFQIASFWNDTNTNTLCHFGSSFFTRACECGKKLVTRDLGFKLETVKKFRKLFLKNILLNSYVLCLKTWIPNSKLLEWHRRTIQKHKHSSIASVSWHLRYSRSEAIWNPGLKLSNIKFL